MIRASIQQLVDTCLAARAERVKCAPLPCKMGCAEFWPHSHQCTVCGWLKPLVKNDPIREVPLSGPQVDRISMMLLDPPATPEEWALVDSLGHS